MRIKVLFVVFALFLSTMVAGQSLNDYKYVIVPAKYDFLKSENQYQLNALTKFLFEKEGFKVIYDNLEMPADIANNPCDALTAKVNNESNMFTTKLTVQLTNCKNQNVFTTEEGKSKQKDYKSGYQEALREAFKDITEQNYAYSGTEKPKDVAPTPQIIEVVEDGEEIVEVQDAADAQEAEEMVEEVQETLIEASETTNSKTDHRDRDANGKILGVPTEKKLYAQENRLGYQLVDSSPKVVFILLKSGTKNLYFLKNRSGNFFKEGEKWYAEYYFDGHLVKQEFDVKW